MLTSILRRAQQWMLSAGSYREAPVSLCVPEWSEALAEHHASIWWRVKPFTMASTERVVALCQSVAYLENHRIPGAIVECGVWKGGGMMAAALTLLALESTQRRLHCYDTFTGMPPPSPVDIDYQGRPARAVLNLPSHEGELCRGRCSLQDVKHAMLLTRYPWEKLIFVPGRIEQTLPTEAPDQIALLRLDTDWYASTYHALEHLYPRLVDEGVLIVDAYGQWQGAQKAVDDYFRKHGIDADLRTVDFACRMLIKKGARQACLPLAA